MMSNPLHLPQSGRHIYPSPAFDTLFHLGRAKLKPQLYETENPTEPPNTLCVGAGGPLEEAVPRLGELDEEVTLGASMKGY